MHLKAALPRCLFFLSLLYGPSATAAVSYIEADLCAQTSAWNGSNPITDPQVIISPFASSQVVSYSESVLYQSSSAQTTLALAAEPDYLEATAHLVQSRTANAPHSYALVTGTSCIPSGTGRVTFEVDAPTTALITGTLDWDPDPSSGMSADLLLKDDTNAILVREQAAGATIADTVDLQVGRIYTLQLRALANNSSNLSNSMDFNIRIEFEPTPQQTCTAAIGEGPQFACFSGAVEQPCPTGTGCTCTTLRASFQTPFDTLADAADACGVDHFNWLQYVVDYTTLSDCLKGEPTGIDPELCDGVRLLFPSPPIPLDQFPTSLRSDGTIAPFVDAPQGGYRYQAPSGGADYTPGYVNENTAGFVSNQEISPLLYPFQDSPCDDLGGSMRFFVALMGVDANGDYQRVMPRPGGLKNYYAWLYQGTVGDCGQRVAEPEPGQVSAGTFTLLGWKSANELDQKSQAALAELGVPAVPALPWSGLASLSGLLVFFGSAVLIRRVPAEKPQRRRGSSRTI